MPTYEYLCEACGHEFELFQSMTAPVERKCPECEKPSLKRLIGTGSAIIFKGSGFYQTDYRTDSYKKDAEAEKKADDKKTAKDKPAKKQDKKPSTDAKAKKEE